MNKLKSRYISLCFVTGIIIFLSGYVFYILVRGFDPLYLFSIDNTVLTGLPLFINSSYATFTHVLALSLFSYALLGVNPKFKLWVLSFWVIINIIFEFLQRHNNIFFTSGTYDNLDIMAVLTAGIVFFVFTFVFENKYKIKSSAKYHNNLSIFSLPVIGLFGILSIIACGGGNYERNPNEPIYLSYDELRGVLKIDTGRQLEQTGKIYLYQNLLLVSEPNIGIHIYDNADPANPQEKAFINLPGNLDIAVRKGYLYADSFIDLVTIDIRDLNNIVEVERVTDVFPYNTYQAINRNDLDFLTPIDRKKGVVIGVIKKPRLVFD